VKTNLWYLIEVANGVNVTVSVVWYLDYLVDCCSALIRVVG